MKYIIIVWDLNCSCLCPKDPAKKRPPPRRTVEDAVSTGCRGWWARWKLRGGCRSCQGGWWARRTCQGGRRACRKDRRGPWAHWTHAGECRQQIRCRGGHQGGPRDVERANEDPRLTRHTVEDASPAVEAGFRAEAPCSAIISKNGFENPNAAYEIHTFPLCIPTLD